MGKGLGKDFKEKILEELRDGGEAEEGEREFSEIFFCFMYSLLNVQRK